MAAATDVHQVFCPFFSHATWRFNWLVTTPEQSSPMADRTETVKQSTVHPEAAHHRGSQALPERRSGRGVKVVVVVVVGEQDGVDRRPVGGGDGWSGQLA
jgi:hypothetical protein